jgi:hypothetical protein
MPVDADGAAPGAAAADAIHTAELLAVAIRCPDTKSGAQLRAIAWQNLTPSFGGDLEVSQSPS